MKKYFLFCFLLIAVNAITQPFAQLKIDWQSYLGQYDLLWNKMPANYYEGPYVGNGLLGTVFFKDTILPNTICFEVGRTDVYDHRTAEQIKNKYPWPKVRLPIGKFLLRTKGNIQTVNFRTHLWDAEITGTITTDKGTIDLLCYVPSDEKIIIIKYKGASDEINVQVAFRPEQGNNARVPLRPMKDKIYEPNPPYIISQKNNVEIITQPLLNGDDYATAWNKIQDANGYSSVYITIANKWAENMKPFNGSDVVAIKQLMDARKKDYNIIQQQHRKWWHEYYPASFVNIPDARVESFYWLQQYRLASAGRPDKPAIDLMGPWYKNSVWLAIWANLNIQLTYYTTGVTNHLNMEEAYFKMIEKYQDQLIQNVPSQFRNDCAAIQTVVMFNDLSGNVFLTSDSSSKQKMSLIALPWIMQQFYIHYRFSMDDERLRNSIYPLMKRTFNVYLRVMYKGVDGKYHLPLTFSDEYGEDHDVNMNLALARWGFKTLITTAKRLNINDEMLPKWNDALQNLVAYQVDERGLKIGRDLSFDKPHRHYSHLFSIFPLYEMNVEDNPKQIPLMEKSVTKFTVLNGDNCMFKFTGAASLWAALGNGNEAVKWLQRSLQKLPYNVPTVTPNGFYSENGWPTFESPIAATRAALDMMLQSWGTKIRIFPVMPDDWKDASFYNLRAEGGFLISAKRTNRKTNWVQIQSTNGEPCVIKVLDWDSELDCSDHSVHFQKIEKNSYRIDLQKKQTVLLFPKDEKTNLIIEPSITTKSFHWGLN